MTSHNSEAVDTEQQTIIATAIKFHTLKNGTIGLNRCNVENGELHIMTQSDSKEHTYTATAEEFPVTIELVKNDEQQMEYINTVNEMLGYESDPEQQ